MAAPPPLPAPNLAHLEPEKVLDQRPGEMSPSPAASISKEEASAASDFKPGPRLYLAFLVLAVLTLMVALDGTSLSVALPIIAQKLHGTAIEAFWAGTSFLLTATVFQPSFGSLSDIFGRRPMVLAALALFLVGVLLAATANNFTMLLAGRGIQGIGGGGILALTEIIVTDLVPLRERGKWVGIISGMWSVGSVTGPIIGGIFSQSVTWRWIFWVNLPFIGVAAVLIPLFLKLNFIPSSLASKLRRVDWVGQVLFIGSTTSFLVPISWGGVQEPWTSWRTLVPLIIGAVGLIGFVAYEIFGAKEPVIRLSVFGNQTSAISYFIDLLHGMILWSMLYYQPLYYEAVKGYSPIISGVALFPATFTVAPMAVVTGFLITILGKYRWAIWLGWAATVVGLGLDTLLDVDTPVYQWVLINLVPGVGLGMLFPSMQFSLQASSKPKDLAFAVALFSFFRTFGQAIGVAISGTIFQNQMKLKLMKYPHYASQAGALAKDAAALVQIIKQTPPGQDKLDLQISYVHSVRTVYIVMCALAGVALFAALFIKAYDLNRALESTQGLVTEKKSRARTAEEAIVDDTA